MSSCLTLCPQGCPCPPWEKHLSSPPDRRPSGVPLSPAELWERRKDAEWYDNTQSASCTLNQFSTTMLHPGQLYSIKCTIVTFLDSFPSLF